MTLRRLFKELGINIKYVKLFRQNDIKISTLSTVETSRILELLPDKEDSDKLLNWIKRKENGSNDLPQEEADSDVTASERKRTRAATKKAVDEENSFGSFLDYLGEGDEAKLNNLGASPIGDYNFEQQAPLVKDSSLDRKERMKRLREARNSKRNLLTVALEKRVDTQESVEKSPPIEKLSRPQKQPEVSEVDAKITENFVEDISNPAEINDKMVEIERSSTPSTDQVQDVADISTEELQRMIGEVCSQKNLKIRTRRINRKREPNAFVASEFLDCLSQLSKTSSRIEAKTIANQMFQEGLCESLDGNHSFEDNDRYYRFQSSQSSNDMKVDVVQEEVTVEQSSKPPKIDNTSNDTELIDREDESEMNISDFEESDLKLPNFVQKIEDHINTLQKIYDERMKFVSTEISTIRNLWECVDSNMEWDNENVEVVSEEVYEKTQEYLHQSIVKYDDPEKMEILDTNFDESDKIRVQKIGRLEKFNELEKERFEVLKKQQKRFEDSYQMISRSHQIWIQINNEIDFDFDCDELKKWPKEEIPKNEVFEPFETECVEIVSKKQALSLFTHTLSISISEASDVPGSGSQSVSQSFEPFVILNFGNQQSKTDIATEQYSALMWNESFKFGIDVNGPVSTYLHLTVMESADSRESQRVVGSAHIDLEPFYHSNTGPISQQLYNGTSVVGKIEVQLMIFEN